MEQRDLLKRYLDAGMAFTTMTRSRAEAIVKELARAGEVQREQVQAQVDDLVQRSRQNTEQLRTLVRKEVGSQFSGLGLATKRDLSALERRLKERFGGATRPTPSKKAPAKKAGAAKPAAGKTAAGKTAAGKTAAEKTAAEKTAARKAAAKKAAATRAAKKAAAENPPAADPPATGVGQNEPSMSQAPGHEAQSPRVSDS